MSCEKEEVFLSGLRCFIDFNGLILGNSINVEIVGCLNKDMLVELTYVKRLSYVFSDVPFV